MRETLFSEMEANGLLNQISGHDLANDCSIWRDNYSLRLHKSMHARLSFSAIRTTTIDSDRACGRAY